MVNEKATITGSNNGTSEENISIKWPFRIIDVTYDPPTPTDTTTEVTITIETNLPMDPDKVPDGWTIVPETDNHKIKRTYKKGETIDTDVTIKQNGADDTDKTHIKYTWPGDGDNTTSNTKLAQTGEGLNVLLGVIGIVIVVAIVVRKKRNKLK